MNAFTGPCTGKIYGPCSSSSGAKIRRYKVPFFLPDSLRVFRELTCFRKNWLYPLSGKPEENRRRGRAWLKELTFSLSAEEKLCSLIIHPEAVREAAGELFCLFDMNFHVLYF